MGDEAHRRGGNQALKEQLKVKYLKVACRVQIWKKTFCQNSDNFGYSFIKNDIAVSIHFNEHFLHHKGRFQFS